MNDTTVDDTTMNDTTLYRWLSCIAILIIAAMVMTAPVTAKSATASSSGPNSATPGETVTISFSVSNTGQNDTGLINDVSIPSGWTVVGHSDSGGTWNSNDNSWLWQTVQSGDTVNPSITLKVPESASGDYSVGSSVKSSEGVEATTSHSISVEAVNQPPTADAGADQTVSVGSSVSLDGSGSTDPDGDIQTYEWDVDGDGSAERTGAQSSYTYNSPGTYSAELTVTDSAGNTDTDTVTVTVEDQTAPTAEAGSDQTAAVGEDVTFDGADSMDNAGIASYQWEFGDGSTATGAQVSHSYSTTGSYTATLTVTDEAGNTDSDTLTVTVEDQTPPTANAGGDKTVGQDQSVSFDGTASTDNGDIVSYEWEFGDGSTATGAQVSHSYSTTGTYTATLTVTDSAGNTDSDTLTVTVEDQSGPTADAGSDQTVSFGTSVTFDGTASTDNDGVVSYEWEFGDGSTATGAQVTHTYDTPGKFTVTLTVMDAAGNSDSDTLTVTVKDQTAPTAAAGSDQMVTVEEDATFDGTASTDNAGITSYEWEFGDGSTATGPKTSYSYDSPGTYTVTLTVTDEGGNTDSDTQTVTVEDKTAPIADAGSDRSVAIETDVTFDATTSTDNVGIASYEWEFGDGSTATGAQVSHSYGTPGTYTVTLTLTDEAGNVNTDTVTVTARYQTGPTADAGSDQTVAVEEDVTFDGTASTDNAGIASYEWEFGDGSTATGAQVTHSYGTPGTYTVTLTVADSSGDTATDTVTVTVEDQTAPTAAAGSNQTVKQGQSISFNGTASTDNVGIANYRWEFGDGSTETGTQVTHTYNTSGTYTATLTVTDSAGNIGSDTLTVIVEDPSGDEPSAGSQPEEIPASEVSDLIEVPDSATPTGAERARTVVDNDTGTSTARFSTTTPVDSIDIETEVSDNITVAEYDQEPDSTGSSPGRSVSVTQISVPDEAEESAATITMQVSVERLEEIDAEATELQVTRFADGEWQQLDTQVRRTTESHVHLTAQTPGFSFFSVSAVSQPEPAIEVSADERVTGTDIQLDASGSTDQYSEITSYEWQIDGETITGETVTTVFESAGEYEIELTVENDAGETATALRVLTVSQEAVNGDGDDDGTDSETDDNTDEGTDGTGGETGDDETTADDVTDGIDDSTEDNSTDDTDGGDSATSENNSSDGDGLDSSDRNGPGFGMFVALFALFGVAMMARRRG